MHPHVCPFAINHPISKWILIWLKLHYFEVCPLSPKPVPANISFSLWHHWQWRPKCEYCKHRIYFLGCWTGTNSQSSTSIALPWIQCKLGKQYLLNKVTPPWESNPEPFSYPGNYGYHRSVCWVKKILRFHLLNCRHWRGKWHNQGYRWEEED